MSETMKRPDDAIETLRYVYEDFAPDSAAAELLEVRDLLAWLDYVEAELTEARMELAAERGEADGALPGWRHASKNEADMGAVWVRNHINPPHDGYGRGGVFRYAAAVTHTSVAVNDDYLTLPKDDTPLSTFRREGRGWRDSMRAAEAEARRLGLLTDDAG